MFSFGGGEGGKEKSFGEVKRKPSAVMEKLEGFFNASNFGCNVRVPRTRVIAVELNIHSRKVLKEMMKDIHNDNEEKWRERAPLLYA